MVYLVNKDEPFGLYKWEVVANKFAFWCDENEQSSRDVDSLKKNLTILANCQKPTGDCSCSPHIPRSKRIFRDIPSKTNKLSFRHKESPSDNDEKIKMERDFSFRDGYGDRVGICEKLWTAGALGAKMERKDNSLFEHSGSMESFLASYFKMNTLRTHSLKLLKRNCFFIKNDTAAKQRHVATAAGTMEAWTPF